MRLFVVDDAAVMRDVVRRVARDLGHDVVGDAPTLELALVALAGRGDDAPAAILVDGRIAGGPETIAAVVRALRAASPASAVVAIAALEERETVRAARTAGASGAVLRPVTHTALAAALAGIDARGDRSSEP